MVVECRGRTPAAMAGAEYGDPHRVLLHPGKYWSTRRSNAGSCWPGMATP
jgi:hypothetical protein